MLTPKETCVKQAVMTRHTQPVPVLALSYLLSEMMSCSCCFISKCCRMFPGPQVSVRDHRDLSPQPGSPLTDPMENMFQNSCFYSL